MTTTDYCKCLKWLARAICLLSVGFPTLGLAAPLPRPLVFLRDVDPTVLQDMRYATRDNFTGNRVPGYESGECVLDILAAQALARAQKQLNARRLSLKVYDCYRPQRAVRFFVDWAQGRGAANGSKRFFPNLQKSELVAQGYIAENSSHTRGVAVDLTLVELPPAQTAPFDAEAHYGACNGLATQRSPDNSVDMGTGFDCFDVAAHTANTQVSHAQHQWRETLRAAMEREGFRNFAHEWWHFTFVTNSPERSFDIDVPAYWPRAGP